MSTYAMQISDYKHSLLVNDQLQASLERQVSGPTIETDIVDKQISNVKFDCECGGTFDEYDRCSDCDNGHDDCSAQECLPCLERLMDRAERMAEGDER